MAVVCRPNPCSLREGEFPASKITCVPLESSTSSTTIKENRSKVNLKHFC